MTSTKGDGADRCFQAPPPGSPGPLGERSALQTQLQGYKKTGGAADGAGNDYEHKMLTLVFLRMLATGHEFQLASNMEAAGKFDDIVMRYRELSDADWNSFFVQLKHKQGEKKGIPKRDLVALSGDFSIVKYCHSHETMKLSQELHSFDIVNNHKIIIFTNASITDNLVDALDADPLLDTGGKAVSFKAGGEVFQELCEWVDIKEALTELHSQVVDLSEEEVATKIKEVLQNISYERNAVTSCKNELLKSPTIAKLKTLLKTLETVKDKDTYSSFLARLQVYTNQAHETKLDDKIKEEISNVWKCSVDLETDAFLKALQSTVKSWWQKDSFYLTQDSPLWSNIIKSQTENLSKSTIERMTEFEMEFKESSLQILDDRITKMTDVGEIVNLCVDSRTAASSLRVHQALAKFRPNEIVLHVNVKALLEREDDVLSAWASRWCHLLVVECDTELDQLQAERIGGKILNVIGIQEEKNVLLLIAPKKHELNVRLIDTDSYTRFNDNFLWSDLTEKAMANILSGRIEMNGTHLALPLSKLVLHDKKLFNKFDLDVISQFLERDLSCGNDLDKEGKIFVNRVLKKSAVDGAESILNSVRDDRENVALLVAEPGMGKTTLITHLANSAKEEDPSAWVVHIKLNDCVQYLKDINMDHFNNREAKKFLEKAAFKSGNSLEKIIFGALLHKLVVFVDGVDEVCPHYEQQVFKLLSFFKDMEFSRLWIASRPVFQTKLETTLEVRALQLVAFSEDDRKEFFNKVWKENVPLASPEKCIEVTESLLTLLNDSLGKDNPILGVPLMAIMIAEIFQERLFSENGHMMNETTGNGRFDVMSMYSKFIKKKFDLYCSEKKKTPNRELAAIIEDEETLLRQMHHNHRLAALRVLFSREEIAGLNFDGKEMFDKDLAMYLQEVSDGREKLGIIDNFIAGKPHFVHRSFAEYFAASWLALHFKDNKRFIERIIFDPAYKLVSEMFHCYLAGNRPLHMAVINRNLNVTKKFLRTRLEESNVNELDAGGRTALHLAVLLSGTDQHPDYVTIVKYFTQKQNARLDVADEVLGWPPLRYAEWSRAWKALQILLEKVGINLGLGDNECWPKPDPALMIDAARDASVFVFSYLVEERGGVLNCRGAEGGTMIHRAAEGGKIATIKYLHKKRKTTPKLTGCGANLNAVNHQGLTAFQEAAQRGAYNVMALLFELKSSINDHCHAEASQVQLDLSLLCWAFAGSLESVKNLVKMGASITHQDNKRHTATWVAMHRENDEVMNWLLLCGSKDGDTPLHVACEKGELEFVKYILSRGDDINAKGWEGLTPLMAAARDNKFAVLKLLLERGTNMECSDKNGNTPLHNATSRGDKKTMKLLLLHGAQVKSANIYGQTSLHLALIKNLDLVKVLLGKKSLQPGDNMTQMGRTGVTPLVAAAIEDDIDAVREMLDNFNPNREKMSKADYINMQDTAHWTVFHFLVRFGHLDMISYLISQGGDQQIRDLHNSTPLAIAAQLRRPNTLRVLLAALPETDRAAAVNTRDHDGDRPLMCGALGGCVECVRLLVEVGAKLSQVNYAASTPLMAAASNNYALVVSFLLEAFDAKTEGILLKDYINMKDKDGMSALDLAKPECRKLIENCLAKM